MSDQILSQEEIDALLTSMDKGEVDLKSAKKEVSDDVKAYDLTSQGKMLHRHFYALEEVYDKFVNLLRKSVSSLLQKAIDVEVVSTEMVKFGEFRQAFSNPTSFNVFSMDPLIGSGLMAIEPNLVFSFIDCMFGGSGKPLRKVREFTPIEQRMINKLAVEVLKNLEKAWAFVYPINISLKKTETKPEFVHLFAPNDLMIVVDISFKGDEFAGNIHLCVSYLTLEPIRDELSSKYMIDSDMEHSWKSQILQLLSETRVKVTAELGRTAGSTVGDLLNLQTGDVIKLKTGPHDPVIISVEKIPKYQGFSGVVKGNQAVQITSLLRRNGGAKNNG